MSSTTTTVLTPEECQSILLRWKEDGATAQEREEFVEKALSILAEDNQAQAMANEISELADSAYDVYKAFDGVLDLLFSLNNTPILARWIKLQFRYVKAMHNSIEAARSTTGVLDRFDVVYMEKVENVTTEMERRQAIALLEPFIVELEDDDESAAVSREFLELKRDVDEFFTEVPLAVRDATAAILVDIRMLEEQMKVGLNVIAGSGAAMAAALRIGALASPVIASLKDQREEKVEKLARLYKGLDILNGLVTPQPATGATTPDIDVMLDGLANFSLVWTGVRSDTVQFNTHLKGGLTAATNSTFKRQVALARQESRILQAGLREYVEKLEHGDWMKV